MEERLAVADKFFKQLTPDQVFRLVA